MDWKRATLAVSTVALTAVAGSSAASATVRYWNSSGTPLTLYANNVPQAQGYGDWRAVIDTNGSRSKATGRLRDPMPTDGDPVYYRLKTWTNSGSCISSDYTSCTAAYYYYSSDGGGEYYSSSSWSSIYYVASTSTPASANFCRGELQVAEEHNNLPDMFSGSTNTKGASC